MSVSSGSLRQPGLFGQLPLDCYTVVVLGFPLSDCNYDETCCMLDKASLSLTKAFPFLAGQVVIKGRTLTNSGEYCIVNYASRSESGVIRRKDCSTLLPSYDELFQAQAPFSMLDGNVLCSVKDVDSSMALLDAWPVFVVQANLVRGGLLLCFATAHNAADMTGQAQIISHFATACRGEAFRAADIDQSNVTATFPLLEQDEEASSDFWFLRRPSQLGHQRPVSNLPSQASAPWRYWRLSATKLAELKLRINAYSMDDAVAALFIQRLTVSRITAGRLHENETVVFSRAVNVRRHIGLSQHYLGHAVANAITYIPAKSPKLRNLTHLATAIRSDLVALDGRYVRSLLSLIDKEPDKTTIAYGSASKACRDITLSSWMKMPVGQLDFGSLLGLPTFVRRPRLPETPGLVYLMPLEKAGDVFLGASLTPNDTSSLEQDELWRHFAEYVG